MQHVVLFVFLVSIVVLLILFAVYVINQLSDDYEKHSAYECGFEPFGDARSFFDVQFYSVGLLYILFDLEIVFLIPFVADVGSITTAEMFNFYLLAAVLLVGFYYEWSVNLLSIVPPKVFL